MIAENETIDIKQFFYDEELLSDVRNDGKPRLKIYPFPETAIVLGRGSKSEVELNIDPIVADEVTVYRRRGGGCSVVLDPGNLIVSVVLPVAGLTDTKKWFNRCTDWMINGLDAAGIKDVYSDGVSDLVIGDRKISGSALYRMKDYAYYTASLLVTPKTDLMDSYLAHPPREPEYRQARPHTDFVVSLNEIYPDITVDKLNRSLEKTLNIDDLINE